MVDYISVDIPANNFSDNDVMSMLSDRLWTDDDIEKMTKMLVEKCIEEGFEDNLKAFAESVIVKLLEASSGV